MHNRLKIILKHYGDNQSKLAEKMNVTDAYISALITGKDSIGLNTIKKILNIYPEINANWFLTGDGNKFIIRENPDYEKIRIENLNLKKMLEVCDEEKNKYQKRTDELQQNLILLLKNNRKD